MSGIMRLPDAPMMHLTVAEYVASIWGSYLITVNGIDFPCVTDGTAIMGLLEIDLPFTIRVPLSHPTTYLNGTAYSSGTDVAVELQFADDDMVNISSHGPEMMSGTPNYLTINIAAEGGVNNE